MGDYLFHRGQRYTVNFHLEIGDLSWSVSKGLDKRLLDQHITANLASHVTVERLNTETVDNNIVTTDRYNGVVVFTPRDDVQSHVLDNDILFAANYHFTNTLRTIVPEWEASTGYNYYTGGWNAFVGGGDRLLYAVSFGRVQPATVIDTGNVQLGGATSLTPNAGPSILSRVVSSGGTVGSDDETRNGNTVVGNSVREIPGIGSIVPSLPWYVWAAIGIGAVVGTIYIVEWGATRLGSTKKALQELGS